MDRKMVIFNKEKEVRVPITDEQYELLKVFLADSPCLKNCYVFASEDEMVKELDEAVKNKMF